MLVDQLDGRELVEFALPPGSVQFAGQRAVLIDTTAMGTLRTELLNQIGEAAARAVFTRLGYVQGWRLAEALGEQFTWESVEQQCDAGVRCQVIQGMYRIELSKPGALSKKGATITSSFEAEQHIAHLGRSDSPTCWMICGIMSGYLSHAMDEEIFVLEERCEGRGDAACHLLGRTRAEWGNTRAEELAFFHRDGLNNLLDSSLHDVSEKLKAVEGRLRKARRALARVAPPFEAPLGMVARSAEMRKLIDLARRIAAVQSTVLITGESGTGKERIAQFVHDESARRDGPFVAVNCGAVTETLLESELFGHMRGSFTGATQDRAGLFEAANGGTLLLDEVGEMTIGMQVKLLRSLQEREVRRVGENKSRPINARVIAATNQDLGKLITAGRFRMDLYYRLSVVELHVPPLRDRREDILPLARTLLGEASVRLERPMTGLSSRAADQLLRYDWPGNVRELENAMERAVALARVTRTDVDDLPEEVRLAVPRQPSHSGGVRPLAEVEKEHILAALEHNDGNQTVTAGQLGIGTATLYRKLKSYGRGRPRKSSKSSKSSKSGS